MITSRSASGKRKSGPRGVLKIIDDHHVRIVNAATGELLRELTIDPDRDYQPLGRPPGPAPKTKKTGPS